MAWTTPRTWSTGELVTAANMNTHVRDNLRYLYGLDGIVDIQDTITAPRFRAIGNGAGTAAVEVRNAPTPTAAGNFGMAVPGAAPGDDVILSAYNGTSWSGYMNLRPGGSTSPGRIVLYCDSGITGTARTIIASGVNRRYTIWGNAYNVTGAAGQPINGAGNVPAGTTDIFSSGGDILRITITSGAMTVARASGSATYDVVLLIAYQ